MAKQRDDGLLTVKQSRDILEIHLSIMCSLRDFADEQMEQIKGLVALNEEKATIHARETNGSQSRQPTGVR